MPEETPDPKSECHKLPLRESLEKLQQMRREIERQIEAAKAAKAVKDQAKKSK